MRGIVIVHEHEVEAADAHPIAGHDVIGGGRHKVVSPADSSLWLVRSELEPGAELVLPERHGDEVVYVWSGSMVVDGRVCPARGSAVIESGAHPEIRVDEPATLVHMGPYDPVVPSDGLNGPVERLGDDVHVVGPRGTYAAIDRDRDSHYYADSTCPTCRLTLLYTSRTVPYVSATHSHSVDELIHIVWGELQLGSQTVRAGDTLAVDADRRYGFRSGQAGFGFLNYRRDASQQTIERGAAPLMEGGLVNGFEPVMDLI